MSELISCETNSLSARQHDRVQPQRTVDVVVPYDSATGDVYLNGIGADLSAAKTPFSLGAIEMSEWEAANLAFVDAVVHLDPTDEQYAELFPCVVPVNAQSGELCLSAIGSNETEARVNVSFLNLEEDEYIYMVAAIAMPFLAPRLAGPTI